MTQLTQPSFPLLPDFTDAKAAWAEALQPRLAYAEDALHNGDVDDKVNAQSVIFDFVDQCPPAYGDLRDARQIIFKLDLANTDDQIRQLQAKLDEFKQIIARLTS